MKKEKEKIGYICKMFIKTMLLFLPLFAVAFSAFAPKNEETTINYKYETNEVNTVDDLIADNIYIIDLERLNRIYGNFSIDVLNDVGYESLRYVVTKPHEFVVDVSFEVSIMTNIDYMTITNSYISFDNIQDFDDYNISGFGCFLITEISDFNFYPFGDDTLFMPFSKCPLEYIPIESVEFTNRSMKQEVNLWINDFVNLPINLWYKSLLNACGLQLPNNLMSICYVYPLYVLWVEIFDLVVHIFLVLPKLAHKFLGEKE